MTRRAQITAFLERAGWAGAGRAMLAGDASNRRYERLTGVNGHNAVLMDAPPELGEDVRPFTRMAALLRGFGLSPPEIFAEDHDRGFLLLEDLGDDLFARYLERDPSREEEFYATAIDALVHLQAQPCEDLNLPRYNLAFYLREIRIFAEWYLPEAINPAAEAELEEIVSEAVAPLIDAPQVLVLRDYHAENLVWLGDREGIARAGQLDFQDAVIGHRAYDLVSLLEDARRDTSLALQDAMIRRYLDLAGVKEEPLRSAMAVLGAQRNLKILGIFARLLKRDGRPTHLRHMPRVWGHVQRDLSHPALAPLADWMARFAPALTIPKVPE